MKECHCRMECFFNTCASSHAPFLSQPQTTSTGLDLYIQRAQSLPSVQTNNTKQSTPLICALRCRQSSTVPEDFGHELDFLSHFSLAAQPVQPTSPYWLSTLDHHPTLSRHLVAAAHSSHPVPVRGLNSEYPVLDSETASPFPRAPSVIAQIWGTPSFASILDCCSSPCMNRAVLCPEQIRSCKPNLTDLPWLAGDITTRRSSLRS